MNVEKRGMRMQMSIEMLAAHHEGAPKWRGHYVEHPLTDDDIAAHARAKAALEELDVSSWIDWPRMEDDLRLRPLEPRREWVPDEPHEDYLARLRAWWEK